MKRIIYKPSIDEEIPNNAVFYTLPINGNVVDVIVDDEFITSGTVLYDSINNIMLSEPFVHHFSGWEV